VIIGNKKRVYYTNFGQGFILNRPEFICQLARKAENLGVIIQTENKIKSINDLHGEYIVDASGCPSTIKRELGIKKGITGIGYQQTLENSNCFNSHTLKIIFADKFGYYWIFPRDPTKNEINLGIAFFERFNYNLKEMLETFKKKQKIEGKINYVAGGLIPIGLQRPLMHKNILFVGDSGVGTFPLTGKGIYRALYSGDIAGKCLAKRKPEDYPKIMNKSFIKWDMMGKIFIKANLVFRRINPKLVFASLNYFADFCNFMEL